ncbi:CDP-alcohol phosphatidyltransferase [Segniliparus rotundus DSM 44985]|uniref:CDP-alcohol phosphatidyltransferase n=1 Tax=Segniliparus rotundus (strain ATCC BAA-972 / CDC 1076 / CIP 108378 / DSM 44985 / JCM 13578) TaxID=640132 RepID=D6ZA54_SEGRD|nr:CDP-alcohol phosphatidyltransferase [Segniliparus rotundus DSM 44985]
MVEQPLPAPRRDEEPGDEETRPRADDELSSRIFTVPNLLSFLRLAGVPLLWWALAARHDSLALLVLVVSGFTDWADGKLARLLDQSSKLGALLDPIVDRLYLVVVAVGFAARGLVPWQIIAALVARDALLTVSAAVLRRKGYRPLEVLYLGKAATFALMSAFPCLLLGQLDSPVRVLASALGWALLGWGGAMYLWTAVLYGWQTVATLRTMDKPSSAAEA